MPKLLAHWRVIGVFVVISLVFPAPVAQALSARRAEISIEPSPSAVQTGLFRTHLELRDAYAERRLGEMEVVILDQGDGGATVLVDATQLEDLARLGYQPRDSNDLGVLVAAHAAEAPALAQSLRPVLDRAVKAYVLQDAGVASFAATGADLNIALQSVTAAQQAGVAGLLAVDDDADGLTNTEEQWWCTDPLDPNSDGDAEGYTDGEEVTALLDFTLPRNVRWGYGAPFGPPNAWPDFNGTDGNPATPTCNDGDYDTIPDYAEAYMVGTRVPAESTDGDKFDDGQELFGVTYCPGAPTSCGYGSYPRIEYWSYIQASMPGWVEPPGDNVFVAAFPEPEVSVTPGSWHVARVTTITTEEGQIAQTEHSYATSATQGQGTSIADTVTWNNWEEVSEAVETPVTTDSSDVSANSFLGTLFLGVKVLGPKFALGALKKVGVGALLKKVGVAVVSSVIADKVTDWLSGDKTKDQVEITNNITNQVYNNVSSSAEAQASAQVVNNIDFQGVASALDGVQYAIGQQGELLARGLYDISYAISQPRFTETRTSGQSWGGSQTTTHEVYEEHTITEGEAFTTGEQWSTAWAVDSSHAADLTFEFTVSNTGTEYARELTGVIVNVTIGDDTSPSISYPAWEKFPSGTLQNLFPGDSHTFVSNAIPLTLEQMMRIDLGERLTVVVEDYSFGSDELFYQNAIQGGVTVYIEDGIEDGDESVDSYVIPTWGVESVQDVLTRYFPAAYDEDGNLNALWTPEFDGTNPPAWEEHYLSDIAWWNVYLTQAEGGSTPLQDLAAQAGSAILFRFNRDSDRDGYNDRAESRYYCSLPAMHSDAVHCADGHLLAEVHPQPEVLAGYVAERNGDVVTVKLAVENNGTFDAYGIDAVMYAPDDTVGIGNNTVGGNGRARPGEHVAVGSVVKAPDVSAWGSSTAKPYAGGSYIGVTDKVYTFTVATPGVVGQSATALSWANSTGGTGTLAVGSGYHAPLPLDVADGLQVGFNTGTVLAGSRFTVQALTPRDTFTYTITSEPYTEPVVVVSYSDPQGSHRFVTPVEMTELGESLAAESGGMLGPLALQIVATGPVTAGVPTETHFVINSPDPTAIEGGHLYLNFVADGVLVAELPHTLTIPSGPTVASVTWSTDVFTQTYDPEADNILIAFWTDYEGNIIDAAARPLNTFQADPSPTFVMSAADTTWNFGTAAQGTVLKRSFSFANTGLTDMLTYVNPALGVTLSQQGSRSVGSADVTTYEITLDTSSLAVGSYDRTIEIRSSDPAAPGQTVHVVGTITALTPDTPVGAMQRPLDWPLTLASGTLGQWVQYTHTLGPTPQTLHPVKVYDEGYSTFWGVGEYAVPWLPSGGAAVDFGDGSHGDRTFASSTIINYYRRSVTVDVAAGQTQISIDNVTALAAGDEVLVIQMRGTGVGYYEFVGVVSITGNTLTLDRPLVHAYTATGYSAAQVIGVPQYRNVTVNAGVTLTPWGWNGETGGVLVFRASGSVVVNGTISVQGLGYLRGDRGEYLDSVSAQGWQGESAARPGVQSTAQQSGAGGGGQGDNGDRNVGAGGGGGGYRTAGQSGQGAGSPASAGGAGGVVYGTSGLAAQIWPGGGGGGGGSDDADAGYGGYGGNGGGIVIVQALNLDVNGSITAGGASGTQGSAAHRTGGGGGGAGGGILIQAGYADLGTGLVHTLGGAGADGTDKDGTDPSGGDGGDGGTGAVHVQYCVHLTGTTSPAAYEQAISCYIAEQVEASPYTSGRLNILETFTDGRIYQIQYGRRHVFTAAGEQTSALRVPAGAFTDVRLDALISEVGTGTRTFRLDIGNDGSWDWEWSGTVTNAITLNSADLSAAFSRYWATHSAPTSGNVDVPVRVYLSQAGQVLLNNLRTTLTGSKVRYARLPAQTYAGVTLNLSVGTIGSCPLTVAADVGDNGTVDWTYTATSASYPLALTTSNLASAFNAYLSGRTGDVAVPVRFYVAPFYALQLRNFGATVSARPDLTLGVTDIAFGAVTPTEGDSVPITVTLHNNGTLAATGHTAAFYATLPNWGEWYIGSAFVPGIPAGGTAEAAVAWSTLGFTGTVPVRVVLDPYDRLQETNETNNEASTTYRVLTRPDFAAEDVSFSDPEPMAGETVTVTLLLRNAGETAASGAVVGFEVDGEQVSQTSGVSLGGEAETAVSFAWTPTAPGPYRLRWVMDSSDGVDEYDEANNVIWRDIYVGFPSPLSIDSGNSPQDPAYTSGTGYGVVDEGQADQLSMCASGVAPYNTFRLDPDGEVVYRFDHLLSGHTYHLDVTLYECAGGSRQESIYVDDMLVAGPVDLGDDEIHQFSVRLDPALYRSDHGVEVAITASGFNGAAVSEVNLHDIDYRYADSGATDEEGYAFSTAELPFGWLDGTASAAGGALPRQTARVDQIDNELRYRFDGLDPAKRYNVHFTFLQATAAGRIQRVRIDGLDTGITVDTGDYEPHFETASVPAGAYADDGSIVVSIFLLSDRIGAMVNEIALEEETRAPSNLCQVMPTPRFTNASGSVRILDNAAPPGTVITALNPRGEVVGCAVVSTAGEYSYLRIYGEDTSAEPPIAGMRDGEIVEFRVSGALAVATPKLYWQNDRLNHHVDLNAGTITGQLLSLNTHWNLVSFGVDAPVPMVPRVLTYLDGRYDLVLGDGRAYAPGLPNYNTLDEIDVAEAYYIRLAGVSTADVYVEGTSVPVTTPISLRQGWNWVGYLPDITLPVTEALQSIDGAYQYVLSLQETYDADDPLGSTLHVMEPGQGYLVFASQAVVLTYPSGEVQSLSLSDGGFATDGCVGLEPTPYLSIVRGTVFVDGVAAPDGARVEVVTPRGEVAGCGVVRAEGLLPLTHVYGEDDGADPAIPGFREGEPLSFKVSGFAATADAALTWAPDRTPHTVGLAVSISHLYLPFMGAFHFGGKSETIGCKTISEVGDEEARHRAGAKEGGVVARGGGGDHAVAARGGGVASGAC